MRFLVLVLFFLGMFLGASAQEQTNLWSEKKIILTSDTLNIEDTNINPTDLNIFTTKNQLIDSTFYTLNVSKGIIIFRKNIQKNDTLVIKYLKYPEFLTQKYSFYDDSKIVKNNPNQTQLYTLSKPSKQPVNQPFDGLLTNGSISRGVTIGNNQNAVTTSNLDLQISGKLSEKVTLKASIKDSNIPLQEGYSQRLNEFDQIFIELLSDNWKARGGDLFLENRTYSFLNFNKRVQGLLVETNYKNNEKETNLYGSVSFARGQFARSSFTGQEGNQGPYKLKGNSGELYVLVVAGSEKVFVNGILLEAGENKHYTIDYNAGELTFTTLYPITSEMRIVVEYQYTQQNYTRLTNYFGGKHTEKKWNIAANIYSENDLKNKTILQNLSDEQKQILSEAGDDLSKMIAPSAVVESYSENKILYKRTIQNATEIYVFSTTPTDELYSVRFMYVGENQGNYKLINVSTIGKIYEYVAPVLGVRQGSFEPNIPLVAPDKIQIINVAGGYHPSEKTNISFETALSSYDKNLFSTIDDSDNQGFAGKFKAKQRLFSKNITIDAFAESFIIAKNFKPIERVFEVEFNRNWNINSVFKAQQSFMNTGLEFQNKKKDIALYSFENLSFTNNYNGNKHLFFLKSNRKNWNIFTENSYLNSSSEAQKTIFLKNNVSVVYKKKKNWARAFLIAENNKIKDVLTEKYLLNSQKFIENGLFVGRGDSANVFVEVGLKLRQNDSLQIDKLERKNKSIQYFLTSKILANEKSNLSIFLNYRTLQFYNNNPDEHSLNYRLVYQQKFLNDILVYTTTMETHSGSIAQQEFTFIEVEPGRGTYMWNDYNHNNIQELQEFEVVPFMDLAKFVKVFLPNQVFIQTHQNKVSQNLIIQPKASNNQSFINKLYNQTSYLIDQKIKKTNQSFRFDLWNTGEDVLGLQQSVINRLFYNRGKQNHSVIYTFQEAKTQYLLAVGKQKTNLQSHQINYTHLFQTLWLANFSTEISKNTTEAEGYIARNIYLKSIALMPKISYLFTKNSTFDMFFSWQNKHNQMMSSETLVRQELGFIFTHTSEQNFSANASFSYIKNNFDGATNTPVAFQMLEGFQKGENLTWSVLFQRNITKFLNLSLNYQGRKSESTNPIHTGMVQLKAFF